MLQQSEEARFHSHWLNGGAGIEMGYLAGGIIEVKLFVQPFDFIERLFACGAEGDSVRAVKKKLKPCCHRLARQGNMRRVVITHYDNGRVPYVMGLTSRPSPVVILRVFSSKRHIIFKRSDISPNEITVWTRTARSMWALGFAPERMQSNQFFSCDGKSSGWKPLNCSGSSSSEKPFSEQFLAVFPEQRPQRVDSQRGHDGTMPQMRLQVFGRRLIARCLTTP